MATSNDSAIAVEMEIYLIFYNNSIEMTELQYLVKQDWSIAYVIINGEPWFRALDISKSLGYIDSGSMMLSCHVSSSDRISLDDVYN